MEGTPSGLDLDELCRCVEQVQGIRDVHDIHAWTTTSGYEVLSAHATVATEYQEETAPHHYSALETLRPRSSAYPIRRFSWSAHPKSVRRRTTWSMKQ
jgi:cobalt-zinc-cadmium efflux system protein